MDNDLIDDDETVVGCDCGMKEEVSEDNGIVTLLDEQPVQKLNSVSAPIKYAPIQPAVKGKINLLCIALKWQDDPGSSPSSVASSGRKTEQVYKELSGGLLDFIVVSKQIEVPYNKAAKNINKAEKYAKARMPKPKNDFRTIYVIVNHGAKGFSNAGGDTAHLYGTLARDFFHEVGHLRPFSLGHSGRYVNGKLEAYGDATSFMGKFSSTKLTGAQLYLLGWLPENKVAQYDIGDAPTNYDVQNLFGSNSTNQVKVVLIPRPVGRPLYLSMPQIQGKPTLCLHLSSGRGTQRVTVFGKQAQYENVLFEKIEEGQGFVTVRVSTI